MAEGKRAGETALAFDPGQAADAGVAFIGTIETAFGPNDCPKNLREARETGGRAVLWLDPPYRAGLDGLAAGDPVIALYWMAGARRDLIRQLPRHRNAPAGVFALRSPARPNPIALGVTRIRHIDAGRGLVEVDALDCWNGTPLIDLKPYLDTVDLPPAAVAPD
jgi:tRNA-Thr(GGU) m(6)t(6)A37 methyltransferase TsaA